MENLLLGTAIQESYYFTDRTQRGGGPARSLFQIEPSSAIDFLATAKKRQPEVFEKISNLGNTSAVLEAISVKNAAKNLESQKIIGDMLRDSDQFSASVAALIYKQRIVNEGVKLPAATDTERLAEVWKDLYNRNGKGKPSHYVEKWNEVRGRNK